MKKLHFKTALLVAIYCTALFGFSHAEEPAKIDNSIYFGPTGPFPLTLQFEPVTNITFSPGITINGKTGEVTIPENVSIPEAAKAFWVAVAKAFPEIRKSMMEEGK